MQFWQGRLALARKLLLSPWPLSVRGPLLLCNSPVGDISSDNLLARTLIADSMPRLFIANGLHFSALDVMTFTHTLVGVVLPLAVWGIGTWLSGDYGSGLGTDHCLHSKTAWGLCHLDGTVSEAVLVIASESSFSASGLWWPSRYNCICLRRKLKSSQLFCALQNLLLWALQEDVQCRLRAIHWWGECVVFSIGYSIS